MKFAYKLNEKGVAALTEFLSKNDRDYSDEFYNLDAAIRCISEKLRESSSEPPSYELSYPDTGYGNTVHFKAPPDFWLYKEIEDEI